ncbi:DUF4190 domain-containing protein [Kitasatospora sp. NPDC059571]|uniref:DUF4190 domain-containing protein n=1 Tax=Kitasatospora sp. NPDC059571 TaxID=3346871 RepID=UPI0036B67A47
MTADGGTAQDTGADAAVPQQDGTAGTAEAPERSAAFASFVRGPIDDDPDARPGWSRLAVASLVPGVIGFLWPVGVVLAVIALLRIRKTKQTAGWAAWTGLALSLIWAVLGTSLFWQGTSGEGGARTVSASDLKPGECFSVQATTGALTDEVTAVPCEQAHNGEAFARTDLDRAAVATEDTLTAAAEQACAAAAPAYLPSGTSAPAAFHLAHVPPRGNTLLIRTHRTVVCTFLDDTGSWKGSLHSGTTVAA